MVRSASMRSLERKWSWDSPSNLSNGGSTAVAKGFAIPPKLPVPKRKPLSSKSLSTAGQVRARAAEKRLLLSAQKGDTDALRQLLEDASGPAWRFSQGFCRDPHDAEDLVQDVLVTLMRTLPSFRGDSSLSTWTYTVARRACARRRKQGQRMLASDASATREVERRADPGPSPHQRLERRELSVALENAISALPVVQKQALVMRDVEGLSAAEVAEVLGIGERAVKSRLHRARVALRAVLAPYVAGGEAPPPGNACPDTALILSQYLEGEVDATVCERMEQHVQRCPSCGGVCQSLREVLSACRAYGTKPVPSEVRRAVRRAVGGLVRDPQHD